MVFVTVGTHEQQFNRLIKAIDSLAAERFFGETIFVQTGYSDYEPSYCEWSHFVSSKQMTSFMREADVVVTHGGPSSFMEAMAARKVPVVVPRCVDYGEHVNNHQVSFVRIVSERKGGIIPVEDMSELGDAIDAARTSSDKDGFLSHNSEFCAALKNLITKL